MGAWERLRNIGKYLRTWWSSTDPDSYDQYRAGRDRERKQTDQRGEQAKRSGEREREGAERERKYEERYTAERIAEEPLTEAPPRDTSQPE
jgi:hypothetical protein